MVNTLDGNEMYVAHFIIKKRQNETYERVNFGECVLAPN